MRRPKEALIKKVRDDSSMATDPIDLTSDTEAAREVLTSLAQNLRGLFRL